MGKKAKAEPKGKAKAKGKSPGPPSKRRRTGGELPSFPAALARPPLEQGAGPLRFLVVDVAEDAGNGGGTSDIRLYGVTPAGNSVAACVRGFRTYFYCARPVDADGFEEEAFCKALSSQLKDTGGEAGRAVPSATRVRKRPLMYYQRDEVELLRVELSSPRLLPAAGREVERGFAVPRASSEGTGASALDYQSPTWETNVPFVLRFMVDTGLVGGGWVELPADSFTVLGPEARRTSAQLEVTVPVDAVLARAPEGEFLGLAPLRLLTIDCRTDDAGCIAVVAATLAHHGASAPLARAAWLLTERCDAAVDGVDLHCLPDEAELLEHFGAFLAHCDPDLVLGYELLEGVLAVLLARAQATQAGGLAVQLGRLKGEESKARKASAAGGQEVRTEVNAEGRLLLDVARLVAQEHRLTSYALPAVVQRFLGGTHFELRRADVAPWLAERPDSLARVVLSDAEATRAVFERLCFVYNLFEMARVTGVPIEYLLTRGQMVKVTSQLLRKSREHGFVLPARGSSGNESFEGGFVMEPKTGLYEEPVVVLDFASLYPSIMMANNLCYTTLLPQGADRTLGLDAESVVESPVATESGQSVKFVRSTLRRGLLPQILEELIAARKAAKKEMAAASDPVRRAVLNGRQLALKISANSVYGFTGATAGNLPCLEIAGTVTAYGREMITSSAAFIEANCADAQVIYGDTDSVMLSFGDVPREEAVARGRQAAEVATARFAAPVRLEFEKVFQPYLLLNKKRYAGLPWNGDQALPLDMKGIETVRRDWCGLVRQVLERSLELLLRPDRSIDTAVEYVRGVVADLRRGATDPRLLVISKTMGKKDEAEYVAKAAHVVLAEKLKKRDPKSAPRSGDRVAYVVVAGAAGAKVYERAEDPQYAQSQELPIDSEYYIEQQLRPPLLRIFELCVGGEASKADSMLFAGDKGRKVTAPSAAAKGGLGAFIKKAEKCLACRAVVQGAEAFCKSCAGTSAAAAAKDAKAAEGKSLRERREALCATCVGCVGAALGDAHKRCANVDCEIFFERARVDKGITEAQAAFSRLKLDW